MWYDRKNMFILLLVGSIVSFIGVMLAVWDHVLLGTLVFAVGISAVVISFAVLRFLERYELTVRYKQQ